MSGKHRRRPRDPRPSPGPADAARLFGGGDGDGRTGTRSAAGVRRRDPLRHARHPRASVLSHEILNSAPYSFLDDAPLEERRARAVQTRRAFEPSSADELGALDPAAIQRVREEVWPEPRDADELHDALLTAGVLTATEGAEGNVGEGGDGRSWTALFEELCATGRAGRLTLRKMRTIRNTRDPDDAMNQARADEAGLGGASAWWVSAERLPEVLAVTGSDALVEPALTPPAELAERKWTREEAVLELVRGRLQMCGPVTAGEMADTLAVTEPEVDAALLALEGEGFVLRGSFSGSNAGVEWCESDGCSPASTATR